MPPKECPHTNKEAPPLWNTRLRVGHDACAKLGSALLRARAKAERRGASRILQRDACRATRPALTQMPKVNQTSWVSGATPTAATADESHVGPHAIFAVRLVVGQYGSPTLEGLVGYATANAAGRSKHVAGPFSALLHHTVDGFAVKVKSGQLSCRTHRWGTSPQAQFQAHWRLTSGTALPGWCGRTQLARLALAQRPEPKALQW